MRLLRWIKLSSRSYGLLGKLAAKRFGRLSTKPVNRLEVLVGPTIGVRHIARPAEAFGQKERNPRPAALRLKAADAFKVRAIHGEDQIEAGKVILRQLARQETGYIHPMPGCDRNCTIIRRFPDMPAAGACRVTLEEIFKARIQNRLPEHTFGSGRAADITKTDKKHRGLLQQGAPQESCIAR